ncbi:uncharacterized protein I303_103213 [Kwoniella dejecticola CBS 10117]|uniref:Major facilitator superfamily (MFS) profile domain-containing protein n=1 Tax=Kwoniella dejecticola CBS 10117 TaxID=1296121 RepID=A0A1A6AAZ1_9TREE|nr:uncharacterized protein I303_03237 [Kwoniella dejecticola CBS 10117]OBR87213.1 hypothetical protein I303_03237 [Kwoniella dejecticola CBS 10117]
MTGDTKATDSQLTSTFSPIDVNNEKNESVASGSNDCTLSKAQEHDGLAYDTPHGRKMVLLGIFSLGMFMDVIGFSVFFIMVGPTATDLGIPVEEQTWIITSYGVTFAAFLLFWGRVSDLYSPKPVFVFGFIGLGVTNLVISFLTEPFSYYVVRAISGTCGACLIPSSYRLIVSLFRKEELSFAFAVYGISGSIANCSGLILGGAVLMIPGHGQMIGWRWHFRIVAALILPAAALSWFLIAEPKKTTADVESKWKRMDIVGALLILLATLLLILGLTLGASHGFGQPAFYVPIIISLVLYPAFIVWERRLPADYALIPTQTWKYQNFTLWVGMALLGYAWWSMEFVPHAETYIHVHGEKPIVAALRVLPQGITAFAASVFLTTFPRISMRARIPVSLGLLGGIIAYVLFILGGARTGRYYWSFTFIGSILGPAAMHTFFNCITVGAMMAVPPSEAGVAGAITQTALQVGSTIGLSIQAGLLTVYPDTYNDLRNTRISWYFVLGWTSIWLIVFLVFYRRPAKELRDTEVIVAH